MSLLKIRSCPEPMRVIGRRADSLVAGSTLVDVLTEDGRSPLLRYEFGRCVRWLRT